jgi:hypothetical protein
MRISGNSTWNNKRKTIKSNFLSNMIQVMTLVLAAQVKMKVLKTTTKVAIIQFKLGKFNTTNSSEILNK